MEILKGERKRIIRRISNSMQMTYQFEAEPLSAQDKLSGTVEVAGSNWIFPKAAIIQGLESDNSVSKGAWDTFYSVYVTPDCDVSISINQSRISQLPLLLLGAGLIILLAVVSFVIMLG